MLEQGTFKGFRYVGGADALRYARTHRHRRGVDSETRFFSANKSVLPVSPVDLNDPNRFQQVLDRIVWKGDLLTLLYVPGSTLKKIMELSKKFDADDRNLLSLSDERGRAVESLGIRIEPGQYFVN